jgi:hypothetical protein
LFLEQPQKHKATLVPTDLYALFHMAEKKGMTVGTLLCGEQIPIQSMELELYYTYNLAQARLEQQNERR